MPLDVSYSGGVGDTDISAISDSLTFGPAEIRNSFEVALEEEGFDGDGGMVSISLGDLPPGMASGAVATIVLTVHDATVTTPTWPVTLSYWKKSEVRRLATRYGATPPSVTRFPMPYSSWTCPRPSVGRDHLGRSGSARHKRRARFPVRVRTLLRLPPPSAGRP